MDHPTASRPGGVQSVDRAFSLMDILAAAGGELTLSSSPPVRASRSRPSTGSSARWSRQGTSGNSPTAGTHWVRA